MATTHRLFAGFGAALFLLTSSALTIAVVLTMSQNSSSNSTANNQTPTISQNSTKASNPSSIAAIYLKDGTVVPGYAPLTKPLTTLEHYDIKVGNGAVVKPGATVKADYLGFLAGSGKVFDSSAAHGGPISFSLSSVIAGWAQGIPGMRVGGTRELLIPASMGYGSQAVSGIPANSDLGFYVQIDSVTNP